MLPANWLYKGVVIDPLVHEHAAWEAVKVRDLLSTNPLIVVFSEPIQS